MHLGTTWRMLRGMPRRGDHQEKLTGFYARQAAHYDSVREKLLHGRSELFSLAATTLKDGARIAEIGCGTGRNLEFMSTHLPRFDKIWAVDLCAPLLHQCQQRIERHGWQHVEAVHADATVWRPTVKLDGIFMSYSLSMIPTWRTVLDRCLANLAPGGIIAVVDFWVSGPRVTPGLIQHPWWMRWLWPRWFRHDGVDVGPDRLLALREHTAVEHLHLDLGGIPGLPMRVPHFRLIGKKFSGQ